MQPDRTHYAIISGEVELWLEQEAIHIKATTREGDPVELTSSEALQLATALQRLAELNR